MRSELIHPDAYDAMEMLDVALNPANPEIDRDAAQRALTAHLRAFGQHERPFRWAEDSYSGFVQVEQLVLPKIQDELRSLVAREGSLESWSDTQRPQLYSELRSKVIRQFFDSIERRGVWSSWSDNKSIFQGTLPWWEAWLELSHRTRDRYDLTISSRTSRDFYLKSRFQAAQISVLLSENTALCADIGIEKLARRDPQYRDLMAFEKFRPMVDAFKAGLFMHWVLPDEIICVPHPTLILEDDELHRPDGPAAYWPTGEQYFFWRGVCVPEWVIKEPHLITVESIRREERYKVRRCMAEISGLPLPQMGAPSTSRKSQPVEEPSSVDDDPAALMRSLNLEAQTLIERLAAKPLERPYADRSAIDEAIGEHLKALDVPARPILWAEDAKSGFRAVMDCVRPYADTRDEFLLSSLARDVDRFERLQSTESTAAAAVRAAGIADVRRSAERRALENIPALGAKIDLFWDVVADSAREVLSRGPGPWSATWNGKQVSAEGISDVIGWINCLGSVEDLAVARHIEVAYPLLEAYQAGLFLYWITPNEVVCVPDPALFFENGRLHRAEGPAVRWPTGERYYFWRGTHVPEWVIEEPDRITMDTIAREKQEHIRRCMAEIAGFPLPDGVRPRV